MRRPQLAVVLCCCLTVVGAASLLAHSVRTSVPHLPRPSPPLSRRKLLTVAAATAVQLRTALHVAGADDEMEDGSEDELAGLVGSASGVKKRTKPADKTSAQKYSAADVSYAFADIVAARAGLDRIDSLLRAEELGAVARLLSKPPFFSFKANAQALVRGPGLSAEDKLQIGNEKRVSLSFSTPQLFFFFQIGNEKRVSL